MQSAVLAMIDSVWPSVRSSVTRWYHAKTTPLQSNVGLNRLQGGDVHSVTNEVYSTTRTAGQYQESLIGHINGHRVLQPENDRFWVAGGATDHHSPSAFLDRLQWWTLHNAWIARRSYTRKTPADITLLIYVHEKNKILRTKESFL